MSTQSNHPLTQFPKSKSFQSSSRTQKHSGVKWGKRVTPPMKMMDSPFSLSELEAAAKSKSTKRP